VYSDTYYLGDAYTATGQWKIENLSVGNGGYQMTYRLTDIYGNQNTGRRPWRLMRFIHTADWASGRLFHSLHLTDDQRFTLDGLFKLAQELPGRRRGHRRDVFDRAVPPPDAVGLS